MCTSEYEIRSKVIKDKISNDLANMETAYTDFLTAVESDLPQIYMEMLKVISKREEDVPLEAIRGAIEDIERLDYSQIVAQYLSTSTIWIHKLAEDITPASQVDIERSMNNAMARLYPILRSRGILNGKSYPCWPTLSEGRINYKDNKAHPPLNMIRSLRRYEELMIILSRDMTELKELAKTDREKSIDELFEGGKQIPRDQPETVNDA